MFVALVGKYKLGPGNKITGLTESCIPVATVKKSGETGTIQVENLIVNGPHGVELIAYIGDDGKYTIYNVDEKTCTRLMVMPEHKVMINDDLVMFYGDNVILYDILYDKVLPIPIINEVTCVGHVRCGESVILSFGIKPQYTYFNGKAYKATILAANDEMFVMQQGSAVHIYNDKCKLVGSLDGSIKVIGLHDSYLFAADDECYYKYRYYDYTVNAPAYVEKIGTFEPIESLDLGWLL